MNNLNPSLPCPHCHAPIQGGLVKGLAAVKECPSCHKKVKFKKPPVGEYFKALLKPFAIFVVVVCIVAAILISLFGTFPPYISTALVIGFLVYYIIPIQNNFHLLKKTNKTYTLPIQPAFPDGQYFIRPNKK